MSRYRVRSYGEFKTSSLQYRNYGTGVLPPAFPENSGSLVGQPLGTFKIIEDYVTPRFKEKIANGAVINNSMSSVALSMTSTPSSWTATQAVGTYRSSPAPAGYQKANYDLSGDGMGYTFGMLCAGTHSDLMARNPLGYSIAALENAALIEALNRVEPAKSQTIVTALEAHKTFDMIVDRVRKLADVVQLVRGRKKRQLELMFKGKKRPLPKRVVVWDPSGAPRTFKNGRPQVLYGHLPTVPTSSRMDESLKLWLEYRYGWSPLVHDIVDSLKAMYAADLRRELIQHPRLYASGKSSFSKTVSSSLSATNGWGTYTANKIAVHELNFKAYILYKVDTPNGLVQRLNDFGAFDVPAAMWEITPWSFVIDWFIPIGDYLGALQPKLGVTVLAAGLTSKYKMEVTRTCTGFVSNPASGNLQWNYGSVQIGASDRAKMDTKSRNTNRLYPSFPPLDVKLTSKHMVDSIALLKGLRQSHNRV